jgi:hypothetical protein
VEQSDGAQPHNHKQLLSIVMARCNRDVATVTLITAYPPSTTVPPWWRTATAVCLAGIATHGTRCRWRSTRTCSGACASVLRRRRTPCASIATTASIANVLCKHVNRTSRFINNWGSRAIQGGSAPCHPPDGPSEIVLIQSNKMDEVLINCTYMLVQRALEEISLVYSFMINRECNLSIYIGIGSTAV